VTGVGDALRVLGRRVHYRCEKGLYRWTFVEPEDISDD